MPEFPQIPLKAGEQYRFHFDLTKCVGCKCCEVACHEQNNNPPEVKWRSVGELEGGTFPTTTRLYVSMACNHCIEPTCLAGCPVDAYYKDSTTGAVLMKEDACIGCGYCTWNCPYDAPQMNDERGMVTKCDFCHNRLTDGKLPACIAACPSGAIELEPVSIEAWKQDYQEANGPGIPDAAITLSTTRLTVPPNVNGELNRSSDYRLKPEKPHYSLNAMTILTQLSVGGFLSLFFTALVAKWALPSPILQHFLKVGPFAMLGMAVLALGTSVFHLGRPLFAFRALKMWKRSWLSREVLFFSLFAVLATAYAGLRWLALPMPTGVLETLGGPCRRHGDRGHLFFRQDLHGPGTALLEQHSNTACLLFNGLLSGTAYGIVYLLSTATQFARATLSFWPWPRPPSTHGYCHSGGHVAAGFHPDQGVSYFESG